MEEVMAGVTVAAESISPTTTAVLGLGPLPPGSVQGNSRAVQYAWNESVAASDLGVTTVEDVERIAPSDIEIRESDARKSIALRLVWAYVGLLLLSIAIPVTLYIVGSAPKDGTLAAIKQVSDPITAGVASVTGVIGFVLGYYFKSEERKGK